MYRLAKSRIQWIWAGSVCLALAFWSAGASAGQKRVSSEKTALPELGDKPASLLKVEKLKGTLKKVDLKKRTVTIAHSDGETELGFPTAAGREKISLSKKAARALGKKSLRLEEISARSEVKVAYYPTLGTIMEITVEELAR